MHSWHFLCFLLNKVPYSPFHGLLSRPSSQGLAAATHCHTHMQNTEPDLGAPQLMTTFTWLLLHACRAADVAWRCLGWNLYDVDMAVTRTPILAIGSNASPEQLARKFGAKPHLIPVRWRFSWGGVEVCLHAGQ